MVDVLIFDADHTLYTPKSEEAYRKKFHYLAQQLGVDSERLRSIWEEQVEQVLDSQDPEQRHRHNVLEKTLKELEMPKDERGDLIDEALERFWSQVEDSIVFNERTPQLLQELDEYGLHVIAIATDEFKDPLERKLQQVLGDWQDYFNLLITPRKVQTMKPSTKYYEAVLRKEDLEAEDVAVVGDSWERDLEPAKAIGMKTVLVADQLEGEPDFHIPEITRLEDIKGELKEA